MKTTTKNAGDIKVGDRVKVGGIYRMVHETSVLNGNISLVCGHPEKNYTLRLEQQIKFLLKR